jgi:hypothetical protein
MPNGRTYYQEWRAIDDSFEYVRSITANRSPLKWRHLFKEGESDGA